MDMPVWSDHFRVGDDAIDSSHQDIMAGLAAVHGAVGRCDFDQADRMVDALSDACSIHAQSEDECFVGRDHGFPHETLDDLIAALRTSLRHRRADRAFGTISALHRALLSDIHADRAELAQASGLSAWRESSRRWLNAAG